MRQRTSNLVRRLTSRRISISRAAISRITTLVQRQAALVCAAMLILCTALAFYSVGNLGINTRTDAMFSDRLDWFHHFNSFQQAFPALGRNVLIVIDGEIPELVDASQRQLVEQLAQHQELVASAQGWESSDFFRQHGLLFLSVDELQSFSERLTAMQPLMGRLQQAPHLAGLASLLSDADNFADDANAELDRAMERLAKLFEQAASGGPAMLSWQSLLNDNADPGSRRLILIGPTPAAESAAGRKALLALINQQITRLAPTLQQSVEIQLTGSLAMQQQELDSVRSGIVKGLIITLLLVGLILWLALRSLRLIIASLLSLLAGLIITAAFASVSIGHLNVISIAFAVLYIGLGIDFAIHYTLRYRELLHLGHRHEDAIHEASADIGLSLTLCTLTSSVGFLTFLPTDFTGVAELGLIAGFGMLASLFATLLLQPALMQLLGPPRRRHLPQTLPALAAIGRLGANHRRIIRLALLLLSPLIIVAITQLRFDGNPLNLRDPHSESVRSYLSLYADPETSPQQLSLLVAEADAAAARDRLLTLPAVGKIRQLDDLTPEQQADKQFILDDLTLLLGMPQAISLADIDAERDLPALTSLAAQFAATDDPLKQRLAAAIQRWQSSTQPERASLTMVSNATLYTLPLMWNRIVAGFTPGHITDQHLPAALRQLWQSEDGRLRLQIAPAAEYADIDQMAGFVRQVTDAFPEATGLPAVQYLGGRTVAEAFVQALSWAWLLVTLLVWLLFRRLRHTLAVMVPLTSAIALTAAIAALLDLPFNFANVIALPLLIGVGVDNGIHMAHRHLHGGGDAADLLASSTARALWFSTLTTVVSFGSLAFSSHPGTASMGVMLALGMTLTLLCTLWIVPALLAGPNTE